MDIYISIKKWKKKTKLFDVKYDVNGNKKK